MLQSPAQYVDEVLSHLENLEYPDLVFGYDELQVATSMNAAMHECYTRRVSARYCAVIIWSLTMNLQIIPQVKH